jgi:hypothetical protein
MIGKGGCNLGYNIFKAKNNEDKYVHDDDIFLDYWEKIRINAK